MINTNKFFKLLGELLREYYQDIKNTGIPSPEREQFINGYLTAARTLNAVYQKELKDYVEKIHFEIFNMNIEERRKSLPVQSDLSEDELEVPAFKRQGIKLKF
jgi:hypothetical protein